MEQKIRTYSELQKLKTFNERYEYLRLSGVVGEETFGWDRILNQTFYRSPEWKKVRDQIILRDNGCDLGVEGFDITGKIIIHHINPITKLDIADVTAFLTDPEFLICTTISTHNAIHYGKELSLISSYNERSPNDTIPWRK